MWTWDGYTVDGGARPDAIIGLADPFEASLAAMFQAAPPEIQSQLRVASGYRSPERQAQLWEEALAKYGSEEAARKWVAPPGRSQHNHGNAVDLRYLDPVAQSWVHANAERFGLTFPMAHEPWHVEPMGARGGQQAAPAPDYMQQPPQNALAAMPQPPQSPQNVLAAMGWQNPTPDLAMFLRPTRNALGAI